MEKCHAFFTLKTVMMEQRSFGDLTNLVNVSYYEDLVMNAQLMSENSKIPYVATAVWRSKDGKPRREGLDLTSLTEQQKEEWRRNTDSIVRKWTAVHGDRMYKEKRIEEIKSEAPESMDTAPPPENEDDMKDMKEEDSNR